MVDMLLELESAVALACRDQQRIAELLTFSAVQLDVEQMY